MVRLPLSREHLPSFPWGGVGKGLFDRLFTLESLFTGNTNAAQLSFCMGTIIQSVHRHLYNEVGVEPEAVPRVAAWKRGSLHISKE